jgi:signal transduction histidine kinase
MLISAFAASGFSSLIVAGFLYSFAYRYRYELPFQPLLRLVNSMFGPVPMILLVAIFLFVVFFFLFTTGAVHRIRSLDAAVRAVARGDLDVRVQVTSQDEIGRLAENLSIMTAQLKESMAKEHAAERAKYDLITSVSHDLRTPLTSILGYLQLIDAGRYSDEGEMRHYIQVAYTKCQQLNRMVEDLFEYTRTSHEGFSLRREVVNLGELLEQLAEEFVPMLQGANMTYRLVVPDERVTALVDPDMMVRALENLISNSIRYGNEGRQIDLELTRQAGDVVLRVANYGHPIPAEDLPHLFETFYRVDKSRSLETGGSGLGLAIVKNIASMHGGSVSAYNTADRVVFEIRLPYTGEQY